MKTYVIALDQGTTSSRAILIDQAQTIQGVSQEETRQIYPKPGWVEQDPQDIWETTQGALENLLADTGTRPQAIAAIGITNQRETTIVWEKATGRPLANAIVWQCRRTSDTCQNLRDQGHTQDVRDRTGLVIDAYFSATKLKWILDEHDPDRSRSRKGEILFGTVDTWLLWNLTGGKVHATDMTNASRTMLYNIHDLQWDDHLCSLLDIPREVLPEVFPSGHAYGHTSLAGVDIPILALVGDQQAALYGQACWEPGDVKNTYGTGCFLLMHTGSSPVTSRHGLVTTLAASRTPAPQYALEGSIFMGGAVVQWLRDELRFVEESGDTDFFARKPGENEGVYLVPAFTGLGAPYWDMEARGAIYGLTRGTGRSHIIRAGLEAIAYQTRDVLVAMEKDAGAKIPKLKVDGGACQNDFLMQFQADILQTQVLRPEVVESTALGAAYLAGLEAGFWPSEEAIRQGQTIDQAFDPAMADDLRERNLAGWAQALARTLSPKTESL